MTLHIDFETRSTLDLKKTGVYRYAKHETTDLWCACYAFDDGPVQEWTPGGAFNQWIFEHVVKGGIIVAHNAAFERVIWEHILHPRYGWPLPKIEQWRCTMVQSYAMALPGSLEDAAASVGLENKKDASGRRLMLQMARPRKTDPLEWWDDQDRIDRLIAYCRQDVETERELHSRLRPLSESELALWHLDQRINDRGVYVDVPLCESAKRIVSATTERLDERIFAATDGAVSRCSNRNQIVSFVKAEGIPIASIAKAELEDLLTRDDLTPAARECLTLRKESAKASVAKIDALLRGMCPDGRARGLLQFNGATPTARWSGRRFQPQNLKRPDPDLNVEQAIDILAEGDADFFEAVYGEPLSIVADTIRGMIGTPKGKKIIAPDYSGIEARVLPWLAGEEWKLDAFRQGTDMYKLTAGGILGKSPEDVTKAERQAYGKVPELALGYQGGVGAFGKMAANYGVNLPEAEIIRIRDGWRAANPRIKQFWWDLETAAFLAIQKPGSVQWIDKLAFRVAGSFLFMRLPSGRFMAYPYPAIRPKVMPWLDDDGKPVWKDSVTYFSTIDIAKRSKVVADKHNSSKWARIASYGGMFAENATQAVARDFLADAMPRVEAAGYPIVLTVHDEIVVEVDEDFGSLEEMSAIMTTLPAWGEGCPIAVEGWEGRRYRK
jgi:DNA polymerase